MKIKLTMVFIIVILIGTSLLATPTGNSGLIMWRASQKLDKPVTREAFRGLVEKVLNKTINKPEFIARPHEPVTREEVALMIVNALEYEGIAGKLNSGPNRALNSGAMAVVTDLQLLASMNEPQKIVTGNEAAVIMQRIIDKLSRPIEEIHSSYAIQSSGQLEVINHLDAVSFGWSQVEYDAIAQKLKLNTTSSGGNNFNIPVGFDTPLSYTSQSEVPAYLMVYLEEHAIELGQGGQKTTLATYLFNNEQVRHTLINDILQVCQELSDQGEGAIFEGVTIDFENFYDTSLKNGFNLFLKELKEELDKTQKKLNVAVPPTDYFKGYDYKTIGGIADRVILMAHDYAPKTLTAEEMKIGFTITPITPIYDIYNSLKTITDKENGINPDKVMLQISFASTQWQVKNNQIINQKPYTPSYDKIFARLQDKGTQTVYSSLYHNPYAVYYDGEIKNVIWYENAQSIQAKIDLAKLFGVNKISLWRLGTIPNYKDGSNQIIGLNILEQLSLD
ncbi:MAG: hypothetical protein K0R69_419 [Clostridia bacterium]|nr:hypothetical protein [Clostridia bacterium]